METEREVGQFAEVSGLRALQRIAARAPTACSACQTEFLVSAGFCHVCGAQRATPMADRSWQDRIHATSSGQSSRSTSRDFFPVPASFPASGAASASASTSTRQNQSRAVLSRGSKIFFVFGILLAGAALLLGLALPDASGVSNDNSLLIQYWRIELLLASSASFLAGILLKRPASMSQL